MKISNNDPCYYCNKIKDEMHWDHFYPYSKGGSNAWWNMKRSCKDCNLSKYDRCGTWWILKSGLTKENTNV